jgi:cobyrinic acid a,c-diamide synthase
MNRGTVLEMDEAASVPRVMIAGTQSGVGKTTVALGIVGALRQRGLRVQPFKVGPDYIDGSYHAAVSGLPCRNLDAWLLPESALLRIVTRAGAQADLAIVEGVMGLFDGQGKGDRCSSAHVARLLRCPVVLVVDASASSASVGAQALGFARFDPRVSVAGVVVNRVYGARHAEACAGAVHRAGLRLLGCIPQDKEVVLPERHLGLIPASERDASNREESTLGPILRRIVDHVAGHVDLDAVLGLAREAAPLPKLPRGRRPWASVSRRSPPVASGPRIGIAMDSAFNFYYRDGLDALEAAGAQLRYFSPVSGEFPECEALYLGGGFPETHLAPLEASSSTRHIRRFCDGGGPVLAECGGFMYLTRGIRDFEGQRGRMVGFLDAETQMVRRLTLAYTLARARRSCLLARADARLRGHEFHSSVVEGVPRDAPFAYEMEIGTGIVRGQDGWMDHGVLASYMHTHLAAGHAAARFVDAARRFARS